jgi:haloalkane dehalogenase
MYVEVRIKGSLKPEWSDWLEGLTVSNQANGETVLNGALPDQAALLGLLNRIHGLNLTLLSFSQSDKA